MKEVKLRLAIGPDAPSRTRAKVVELRPHVGESFDDMVLILSELVTNSIRHAGGTGEVDVWVGASDDQIRIEVTDGGAGFDTNVDRDGLGLHIVERLADKWGVLIADAGCTVWAEMPMRQKTG